MACVVNGRRLEHGRWRCSPSSRLPARTSAETRGVASSRSSPSQSSSSSQAAGPLSSRRRSPSLHSFSWARTGSDDVPLPGVYFAFVIAWRSSTQFIALRLLAALRALDRPARLELRAVVQTRVRIDSELRKGVGAVLQQIVARGETARASATADPASALAELRYMVSESRQGLADARRVAASYRGRSLRAELDAAAALLEASGARVRIVAQGVSLDLPDPDSRVVIRTAVGEALLDEPRANYRMDVTRDRAGTLRVSVSFDDSASNAAPETT